MHDTSWVGVSFSSVMLVDLVGNLGKPTMTWNRIRYFLFLFSGSLLTALIPPLPITGALDKTLDGLHQYVFIFAMIIEILLYTLLIVATVDLLTPEHVKSKICHFSLRKFLQEHPVDYPTVFPAIYSTVYPVVYVGLATCAAVYSSFFMKWFFISGLLNSYRISLIKLNGVSKLNFMYTLALIVFPLMGSWSALVSAHNVLTKKWISTSDKVFGVLAPVRLVVEVLFTIYCVIDQTKPDAAATGDGLEEEKETETETKKENINDKTTDNLKILTQFSAGMMMMVR